EIRVVTGRRSGRWQLVLEHAHRAHRIRFDDNATAGRDSETELRVVRHARAVGAHHVPALLLAVMPALDHVLEPAHRLASTRRCGVVRHHWSRWFVSRTRLGVESVTSALREAGAETVASRNSRAMRSPGWSSTIMIAIAITHAAMSQLDRIDLTRAAAQKSS